MADYAKYSYISLDEVINNFIMIYTGDGKVLGKTPRVDVLFHVKRGMQEFSYDILKSTRSMELEVPHHLKLRLPPDYVNYISISKLGKDGLKYTLFPFKDRKVSRESPIQDIDGVPIQDELGEDIQSKSKSYEIAEDKAMVRSTIPSNSPGLDPYMSNANGYYNINIETGELIFTSDMIGETILLEYLTDGLAYDSDMRIPKLAEEALYAYTLAAIINLKPNTPEYVVRRYQKDRKAKMRNAKIRLSNIKNGELIQVMRNKSKMIKH
jgi:hypothetical protein